MHEADMDEVTAEFNNLAAKIQSGVPTLHRMRTKGGQWIWLETKGTNMMDDPGIGGIIINARDVTERKLLEDRLAAEQQRHQRDITSAVITAQENERSQLGRELHDNVNQVLTTVKLYTDMIGEGIGDSAMLVAKAGVHLQNCIDEIRTISKRLSPPAQNEMSLSDSISELVESINLTNRISVVYTCKDICELQLEQDLHLAVYRIIQEQLNNVLKHAGATEVKINVERQANALLLAITDNGRGLDLKARRKGIGITNMRTRAENLSGTFRLASEAGAGCCLEVCFPLSVQRDADSVPV
jgi:signal transduction histidine kinase